MSWGGDDETEEAVTGGKVVGDGSEENQPSSLVWPSNEKMIFLRKK